MRWRCVCHCVDTKKNTNSLRHQHTSTSAKSIDGLTKLFKYNFEVILPRSRATSRPAVSMFGKLHGLCCSTAGRGSIGGCHGLVLCLGWLCAHVLLWRADPTLGILGVEHLPTAPTHARIIVLGVVYKLRI